jgi:hypothetical protein
MDNFMNLISFGASGRIERRLEKYQFTYRTYCKALDEFNTKNSDAQTHVYYLVYKRQKAFELFKKIENNTLAELQIYLPRLNFSEKKFNHMSTGDIASLTVSQISIASILGLSAGAATYFIGNMLSASMISKLGFLGTSKIGMIGLPAFKTAMIASGGAKAGIITGTLAKGGFFAAKVGATAIATSKAGGVVSAAVGFFALPVALFTVGAISHWQADKQIEKIDEEESLLISEIGKYKNYSFNCESLAKSAQELALSIDRFLPDIRKNHFKLELILLFARVIKRFRNTFGVSPVPSWLLEKIDVQYQILNKLLEVSYKLITIKL